MIKPILLTCLLIAAGAGQAADLTIDTLMNNLAQKPSERATFVEKKTISLLDKPVESSGELFYRAPDLLEKRTLKPKYELMRVEGDNLNIEQGKKKHQVKLSDYPEIGSFVDSIRGTLAGDRKALERNYKLTLDGVPERWSLQLTPIAPKMSAMIQKITIGGRRTEVRTIDILQADGDRSVMSIERVAEQKSGEQ